MFAGIRGGCGRFRKGTKMRKIGKAFCITFALLYAVQWPEVLDVTETMGGVGYLFRIGIAMIIALFAYWGWCE